MPLCQGLPEGPCPLITNDKTVTIGKGDYLLCPSCDVERRRVFDEGRGLLDAVKQSLPKSMRSASPRAGSSPSTSACQQQVQSARVAVYATNDVTGATAAPSNSGDKAIAVVTLIY